MSIHGMAMRGLRKRPGALALMLAEQLLARVAVLAPLWLPLAFPALSSLFPFSSFPICLAAAAVLYWLAVFPLRNRAALLLTRSVGNRNLSCLRLSRYPFLVCAGFLRWLLGMLWGIPFLLLCWRAYFYLFVYEASRYGMLMTEIGNALGTILPSVQPEILGLTAVILAFALSLLLFLYGWHRGVAYDFQMVGNTTPLKGLRMAKRVRKACKGLYLLNALINSLLLLPALALPILLFSFKCGGFSQMAMTLNLWFSMGMLMEPEAFYWSLALFAVLYLPFVVYRKMRNAAVTVNCYDGKR